LSSFINTFGTVASQPLFVIVTLGAVAILSCSWWIAHSTQRQSRGCNSAKLLWA